MTFGVVSGVGRGMGVLGDCLREGADLGVNLGPPIVTNGDFVAQLCESDELFSNYFEDLFCHSRVSRQHALTVTA